MAYPPWTSAVPPPLRAVPHSRPGRHGGHQVPRVECQAELLGAGQAGRLVRGQGGGAADGQSDARRLDRDEALGALPHRSPACSAALSLAVPTGVDRHVRRLRLGRLQELLQKHERWRDEARLAHDQGMVYDAGHGGHEQRGGRAVLTHQGRGQHPRLHRAPQGLTDQCHPHRRQT